jgi:pyridoxamine 5'-phosphate oxidase
VTTSLPTPVPADPLPTIIEWLAAAAATGRRNPHAMALATADTSGRPSVRMVLLKALAADGYAVFYTNYGSRKAREIERSGRAAAVMYWEDLGRQVRFEGLIVRSPDAESDAYFAARPWRSQLNALSSEQSRALSDPETLDARAARIAAEHGVTDDEGPSRPFQRPRGWGGYRLWLDTVELWTEGADRFHERLQYAREITHADRGVPQTGPWSWQRLQP